MCAIYKFCRYEYMEKVLYYIQFVIHYFVALHRAGKHMENSIIASYVALLLGCLIQDNSVSSASVIILHYCRFRRMKI